MKSSVRTVSPVVTELEVEVAKEAVNKALEKAYSQLGRTAQIKGFRRGKVPRTVLRRMFSEAVRNEVRSEIVGDGLKTALEEHGLEPVSPPSIEPAELQENAPYSFKVTFENRQRLDQIKVDGIELEGHRITVKPEAVDAELARLRASTAKLFDLESPRPAATGDLAGLHIRRWIEGEWKEGYWTHREVALGETPIEKEVEEAVLGMQVGEEKVIELGGPKEAAGTEVDMDKERARYLIRLETLKGRKLADLDDEFAKDMGEFGTLEELKKDIEKRLLDHARKAEDQRRQAILFDKLREQNPMELPPSLVERQKVAFAMRLENSLAMLGDGALPEGEREKMFERAESAAREMVHQHLLLLEYARVEKIQVEEKEIDAAIAEIAAEHGYPEPMVKAEYAKEGRREELAHRLLEKKIFDLALPRVKMTEIDPPTEPAKKAEEEGA